MTNITVFGASHTTSGEPLYEQALLLGKLIGGAGWGVLTGGYIGTMEAVSRGVAESGSHVIGVTCDEIENWRHLSPNRWVMEERRFPTNIQRLISLIKGCDAAVALPGGIGTLSEVAVMWSQLQIGAITPRPLILVGPGWRSSIETFIETQGVLIPKKDHSWLTFTVDVGAAFESLAGALGGDRIAS
jgi:uncharacterized protein (TIGR00730 family)